MDYEAGLTREQAARMLGVTPASISMWALRGWRTADGGKRILTVVGRGHRNQRLYRLGDLLEAERDTRINPNSRRRTSALLAA
jgi:predicted transcriptional regulator